MRVVTRQSHISISKQSSEPQEVARCPPRKQPCPASPGPYIKMTTEIPYCLHRGRKHDFISLGICVNILLGWLPERLYAALSTGGGTIRSTPTPLVGTRVAPRRATFGNFINLSRVLTDAEAHSVIVPEFSLEHKFLSNNLFLLPKDCSNFSRR